MWSSRTNGLSGISARTQDGSEDEEAEGKQRSEDRSQESLESSPPCGMTINEDRRKDYCCNSQAVSDKENRTKDFVQ